MRFTTEVDLPLHELDISHATPMMLMGSCFAQNMGQFLLDNKFCADVNPFGIMYNPLSIATALKRIANGRVFDNASPEVVFHNGLWHSLLHHGDFSRCTKDELIEAVNARLLSAKKNLEKCELMILTFGTAYVYRLADGGAVVGNCHKLPQKMFTRTLLSVKEITDAMQPLLKELLSLHPGMKILFTVSPIRHLRDGAHDNQLSKATLLLAIEELRRLFPHATHYFPSYEILIDELRDYRYYARDMVHPSEVAVDYLWECFSKCYFSQQTINLNQRVADVRRALAHRPFNVDSCEYHEFIGKILLKIEELREKYPYFDFDNEITQCNILLNK